MDKEVGNSVEEFFLNSNSEQLEKVYGWARARYVAPWAVFFGVLLRVAASVPPTVQLPPVIGGRASLNLLCAFVGQSGTGKGNSAKVAALAWPTDILTLPIGSGQGIAETFTKRTDSDEIHPVIFDVPEIDTITGLASAQGSVLLPTLKSVAMGEQLGQANATRETRRNVPAHSYRACLSVGAQPGHTDVIFADATGGTPQRFLWVPVTDPNIPDGEFSEPEPLATDMPTWKPGSDGAVEIAYSATEIVRSIRTAHIARQRGDGDALDGHALLTRCKVAALLAIMHGRIEVTEWDWSRSAAVMAVSDETRRDLIRAAEDIKRQRELDAGAARAVRSEGYEVGRTQSAMRAIVEKLKRHGGDGMARNDLRTSLSTANRHVFDSAIRMLAEDGAIEVVTVRRGTRYRLDDSRQGGSPCQGVLSQVNAGGSARQGGKPDNVLSLENRRSQKADRPKLSCQKWFDRYLAEQREQGCDAVDAVAVREAGMAAGYSLSSLYVAANKRGLKGNTWLLTG
jgi:hypothetical protein